MMKSTTVRYFGLSGHFSLGSLIPREVMFSRNFSGMDLLLSTFCIFPPFVTSKFKRVRERSMRPFSFACAQPLSVQRRWCSLLWAVVNPFFASKCTTCFCVSILPSF